MEVMTFNIDKDRRNLVDDKQNFNIDFHDSKYNWLQARQYEESMRQVEVHVVHGDGSPVDLTGVNPVFEGWMPEGLYRIIDAKHSVMIDAQNGIFRFDFPAPAFQIAGSYKQAFFRLMKDGKSVTTLEFSLDVMADKVISGLVPSDYITPFEDEYDKLTAIVDNADSKFAAQLLDWKNQFNKIVGDLNGDYIRIKSLADALDARLKTLEDKIKTEGLLTQADFNLFEQKIEALLALPNDATNDFFEDEINEIGGTIPTYYRKRLDELKIIPQENLNIGFITDNHLQMDGYAPHSLNHYATIAAVSRRTRLDAIIAGGDNINGDYGRNENLFDTQQYFSALTSRVKNGTDVFAMFGNHDTGIGQSGHMTKDTTISPDEIKLITKTAGLLYGEKRNGDSLYGYKDYTDKKVRVIWLNSFDLPTTVNSDGTYKFNFLSKSGFQNAQLNWLAVDALKLPDKDWQVLMFSHAPIAGTFDSAELGKTPVDQDNTDALLAILSAYQNGTSYTAKDTSRELPIDLNVDFGDQGKGTLIAFISGHVHQDGQMTYQGINCIQTTCSLATILNADRVASTENEDAWDIFSINTAKRSIHAYRLGYGADRDFNY